jgi:hypothetical protein
MFHLTYENFLYIIDRLSQFYIANEDIDVFLQRNNYIIPLENFLCFCYGADYSGSTESPRKIEVFQFVGQVAKNKGYYIKSYELPVLEEVQPGDVITLTPSKIYHINDCNHLRQHIFHFHDKTSLFRSTLFFVPGLQKLYRIHCLMSFITLPVYEMCNESEVLENETCLQSLQLQSQKFLIPDHKKKQILVRLQNQLRLCEASIKAHGSLEQSLP